MDQFKVEDLLIDFSKDVVDSVVIGGGGSDNFCASDNGGACGGSCTDSSAIIDSFSSTSNSNYSNSGGGGGYELNNCFSVVGPPAAAAAPSADYASNFSGDLCVPQDDFAELEWLSNFVDDQSSFSTEEDLHRLQLISGVKAGLQPDEGSDTNYGFHHEAHQPNFHQPPNSPPTFDPDMPVPGKARSKRSRASPGNWASSSLLMLSDTPGEPGPMESKKVVRAGQKRKQSGGGGSEGSSGPGEARKCLHCLTEKTPQWRTGPLGPKTLCNACGVRYKSGRLVPEYRPASSPTFVLAKHSNSHRKVMELRRQKELMRSQQIQQQQFLQSHQSMVFGLSNGDDYMIHQHVGPDFRRLI